MSRRPRMLLYVGLVVWGVKIDRKLSNKLKKKDKPKERRKK